MVGSQIREWRWAHHLSQPQLAAHLNVTVLTIRRWEADYQSPPGFLRLALERLDQLLVAQPQEVA